MSPLDVTIAVLAAGGVLDVANGRLRVRMPPGATLPPGMRSALQFHRDVILDSLAGNGRDVARTVKVIRDLGPEEQRQFQTDLMHDLVAYSLAVADWQGPADHCNTAHLSRQSEG